MRPSNFAEPKTGRDMVPLSADQCYGRSRVSGYTVPQSGTQVRCSWWEARSMSPRCTVARPYISWAAAPWAASTRKEMEFEACTARPKNLFVVPLASAVDVVATRPGKS